MKHPPQQKMRQVKQLFFQKLSIFLGTLGLFLALAFSSCNLTNYSTASFAQPTEFRIGYQVVPNAELLAKNLGLAEAIFPDVKIKWEPFTSGRNVILALADNQIDVGLAGSVPAAAAIAQGLPVQVYFIHNLIGDNEALAVTQSSKIDAVQDLAGKRIGVPFGSTTHFSLLSALDNTGVSAENVEILDMQPGMILSAWKRGIIDGGFIWQPTLNQLVDNQGKVLLTAKELAAQGFVTADLGLVNQEFLNTYPNFLASYVNVLNAAVQEYRDNPQAAAEAIAPAISLSPEASLSAMSQLVWLSATEQTSKDYMGTPDSPGNLGQILRDSAEFMVGQNALPPAPPLETFQAGLFNQALEQALKQESEPAG